MKSAAGFTLIELLVALTIFGVISVLSVRALSAALEQRTHVEREGRKWRDLGRALAAIEADLGAALGAGTLFDGRASASGDDGVWLRFARSGSADDGEMPVAPRTVAYRLAAGHIERSAYASLHAHTGMDALGRSVYPAAVAAVSLRYLSERGEWLAGWNASTANLPLAVELQVELASRERVRRVMLLR